MLGIIDSGVGGLSVVKAFKERFPDNGILYVADQKYMPYGELDKKTLFARGEKIISFLLQEGATHIVIACNTLETSVGKRLRKRFSVPFFSISESVKIMSSPFPAVGLLGTKVTIASRYFQTYFKEKLLFATACPLLAPMIESGTINLAVIEEEVHKIPKEPIPILIACTHFSFIKTTLSLFLPPNASLLDPSPPLASTLPNIGQNSDDRIFTTGDPSAFLHVGEALLGTPLSRPTHLPEALLTTSALSDPNL